VREWEVGALLDYRSSPMNVNLGIPELLIAAAIIVVVIIANVIRRALFR
jgi:hypothetical protein